MPFDGNGTFTPLSPEYPAVAGTTIEAADWNAILLDIASGLSNTLTLDGQSIPSADLPMGTKKLTGLGAGSANGHSLRYEQIFPNLSLPGTLGVTGNTTLSGALGVTGAATFASTGAFTGAVTGPTATAGDSSTKFATTAFVQGVAMTAALPNQAGNGGKIVTTDGASASWTAIKTIRSGSLLASGDLRIGPGQYDARTSNTILGVADEGKFIDITSGTFSQTFSAAATLGSGWSCIYRNSGTGDVTLDPNGAETIDGLATFVMYPGECRLISCTGSALISTVLTPFQRTFTASGTFTKPPGYKYFGGLLWAGGGSGARGSTAGGAGGGACAPFQLLATAVAASETVTIAATTAGRTTDGVGTAGGNSSLGTLVVSYGGLGGAASDGGGGGGILSVGTGVSGGAPGGGGTGADSAFGGGGGGNTGGGGRSTYGGGGGGVGNAGTAGAGGASVYGGGGAGGASSAPATASGGTSIFGGAGGASGDAASGTDGTAPGGGGGATRTGAKAGDGARGELRIWGIC